MNISCAFYVLSGLPIHSAQHVKSEVEIMADKQQVIADLEKVVGLIKRDTKDITPEEKKEIFNKFVLPKVLKRIGLNPDECRILPDGVDAVIDKCAGCTGIRDIEQAAEHIVAHVLYQIEVNHVKSVTFDRKMVNDLL